MALQKISDPYLENPPEFCNTSRKSRNTGHGFIYRTYV